MKEKFFLVFFLFFVLFSGLFAQSTAVEIETLLAANQITYSQAARFALEASGKLATYNHNDAFRYAAERKWFPKNTVPDQPARLDGISLLLMNSFDLRGGIMYSITKSPHFAYRELVYKNVIQGRTDPAMIVSGELLLFLVSRLLIEHEKKPVADQQSDAERAAREEAARRERESAAERAALAEQAALEEAARREREAAERAALTEQAALEEAARRSQESDAERAAREEAARREREAAERAALAEQAAREEAARRAQTPAFDIRTSLPHIYFMHDSIVLTEPEKEKLREIANILRNIPGVRLRISGHTALAGTAQGRRRISLERAQVVADYLVSLGAVDAANITTAGYSADRPAASNITASGKAVNRRAEITILGD